MEKHDVSSSRGLIEIWREKTKAVAEKKKANRPPHHDLTMTCVVWGALSNSELARELLSREGVARVRIVSREDPIDISK